MNTVITIREDNVRVKRRPLFAGGVPGDTLVLTPYGYTRADELRPGDDVRIYTDDGIAAARFVAGVMRAEASRMLRVTTCAGVFRISPFRTVLTPAGERAARRLKHNDALCTLTENGRVCIRRVSAVDALIEPCTVYNIVTEREYRYVTPFCVIGSFALCPEWQGIAFRQSA